jgi:hypothetical protein
LFISLIVLKRFHRLVTSIISEYSEWWNAQTFITTGALPALASMFSIHDKAEEVQTSAAEILCELAFVNDEVCQYILTNSSPQLPLSPSLPLLLPQMILYHEEISLEHMLSLLSKVSTTQLTSIFCNIFNRDKKQSWIAHAKVLDLVKILLTTTDPVDHRQMRQAIGDSNILKFALEELLKSGGQNYYRD